MALRIAAAILISLLSFTTQGFAQTLDRYTAIDAGQRGRWIAGDFVGPRSVAVAGLSIAWSTAWETPEEWGRSWSGVGKRYLAREADVAISDSLEAGVGALWGEDPRYFRAPRGPARSRLAHAVKTVVLAPRRDGRLAPAWARIVGNSVNNVIENSWLPPSQTTASQTAMRSAKGLLGRLVGNVFEEFWPDIKARLHKQRRD